MVGGRGTARAGMGRPTALGSISSLRPASQPVFHAVRLPRHDAPDQWAAVRAGVDRIAQCRETPASGMAGVDTRSRPPSMLDGHWAMALTWPHRGKKACQKVRRWLPALPRYPAPEAYNFRSQAWERRGDEQDCRVTLAAISGRLGSVTRECREQARRKTCSPG